MLGPQQSYPRQLTPADLDQAALVMSRAFCDDPLWQTLIPDRERRLRSLPNVFKATLALSIDNRRAYGVNTPLEGIAVWSEPGQSPARLTLSTIPPFLRLISGHLVLSAFRSREIFTLLHRLERQYAPEPHYYLQSLGVLPEAQGQGLASQLIRPFLEQADARRLGTYVETMTPSNVSLYEHYGFRCMERCRVPRTGLEIWALLRPSPC
jgi:ribosomal protein S18 acetylase RimI-like enzyme